MALLTDTVLDAALNTLTNNGTRIDICTSEPATYAAISSISAGYGTASVGSPADRTGGGREVTVAAVSDGTVTATATATHYAISNGSSTLYATGSLSSSQSVTSGNDWTMASFKIAIPDPA